MDNPAEAGRHKAGLYNPAKAGLYNPAKAGLYNPAKAGLYFYRSASVSTRPSALLMRMPAMRASVGATSAGVAAWS